VEAPPGGSPAVCRKAWVWVHPLMLPEAMAALTAAAASTAADAAAPVAGQKVLDSTHTHTPHTPDTQSTPGEGRGESGAHSRSPPVTVRSREGDLSRFELWARQQMRDSRLTLTLTLTLILTPERLQQHRTLVSCVQ